MTKAEKLRRCVGCRDDFYNGKNPMGIKECWCLKTAKLVRKKAVHVDQRPPWTQKAQWLFDCYHQDRYVYVKPEQTK
jgi:hypothetical protein